MQEIQKLEVTITLRGMPDTSGQVQIQHWNKRARGLRTFKACGIVLLMTVAAVFIPILHFILVPSLLLSLPFMVAYFYRQESVILGGSGTCPKCQQTFTIVRSANRWPLEDSCEGCHARMMIKKPT